MKSFWRKKVLKCQNKAVVFTKKNNDEYENENEKLNDELTTIKQSILGEAKCVSSKAESLGDYFQYVASPMTITCKRREAKCTVKSLLSII